MLRAMIPKIAKKMRSLLLQIIQVAQITKNNAIQTQTKTINTVHAHQDKDSTTYQESIDQLEV